MEAILKFNLDEPEDEEKFRVASKATEWYLVCLALERKMRDMLKYYNAPRDVEIVREFLHTTMQEYGVSLEDMS